MRYNYTIYVATQAVAAFSTDEPLPHLEIGHQLLLAVESRDGPNYSSRDGYALVVESVRVSIVQKAKQFQPLGVHVFCREQEVSLPR